MNPLITWALAVAVAAAGNVTLLRPALDAHRQAREDAAAVHAEYLTAEQKMQALPQLREQVAQAEAQAADAARQFPAEENLGILLARVQQAAQDTGLTVSTITRATQPSTMPGMTEVRLGLSLAGRYPQLLEFLNWTRDERRVLSVTELDSANGSEHRLNITGYTRTAAPAPAATPGQPDGPTGAPQ